MANPQDVYTPGSTRAADEAFDSLPANVQASNNPNQTTPANASPNNVVTNINGPGSLQPFVVDQEILVGPAQTAGTNIPGDASGNTKPVKVDQEIGVGPSQNAGTLVQGGTFSPQSANTQNTTQNSVVGQTYGTGTPSNVFV